MRSVRSAGEAGATLRIAPAYPRQQPMLPPPRWMVFVLVPMFAGMAVNDSAMPGMAPVAVALVVDSLLDDEVWKVPHPPVARVRSEDTGPTCVSVASSEKVSGKPPLVACGHAGVLGVIDAWIVADDRSLASVKALEGIT